MKLTYAEILEKQLYFLSTDMDKENSRIQGIEEENESLRAQLIEVTTLRVAHGYPQVGTQPRLRTGT